MELCDRVLAQLGKEKESVSGEQLAHSLSVSRNAVWKAINLLRERGYLIDAVTNKGYRLSENNEKLCAAQIEAYTHTPVSILLFDQVESTNITAKQLAEQGAPEGTVVIACEQTAGRGRLGRSFYSPVSGVYFTILLRPAFSPEITLLATTAAAVAVARAAEQVCGKRCEIKWVNDVYIDGKKICGILTEGSFNAETSMLDYAVLGIGININTPDKNFPEDIIERAASLFEQQTVSSRIKSELIGAVIDNFFSYYASIEEKQFMSEYKARSFLSGKQITYIKDQTDHTAIVQGIDDNACLIVEENGKIITIGAGDVSVKVQKK